MEKNNLLIKEAELVASYLRSYFGEAMPNTAVILGSGLANFINMVKVIKSIKYSDIPLFPKSGVLGHKGSLTLAELDNNKRILVMEGRFHYYEGYPADMVTFPIVVFNFLGISNLVVSNAAGGINIGYQIGDLMIITDHINFTGMNPLLGKNDDILGPRFLDQTEPYSLELINIAKTVAIEIGLSHQEGVYLGVTGPTYETKAEIRAYGLLGADVVGMSTIFEVIVANYFKMKVLGISTVTNLATGLAKTKHNHSQIVEASRRVGENFSHWVKQILYKIF
ncbi:MAG: purine-nucleoside phosphorylase [Bacteroidia bacterium]|nr:MAG: purine-nucleoside phosphorylase [Bacteroidia bacterium]